MKRFVVIGCGRFGLSVAKTLYSLGNEIMAIDVDKEKVKEVSNSVNYAVQADVMDEFALIKLEVGSFDVAIVSIGSNLEASVMATLIVKELGVKKVIAKAQNELHGKVLSKIGADEVIFPERDMGIRVAYNLESTNILDFIELSPEYSIVEIAAIKGWENKKLKELRLPTKYGINVMAIKRGKNINISPYADDIVEEGDILVVIGNTKDIRRVERNGKD